MNGDSTRSESGDSSPSKLFWFFTAFAAGFFIIAFIGAVITAIILLWPHSWFTELSIITLQAGEATTGTISVETVVSLLVNIVGASGSLSLSLALAAIYLSQNRILSSQTAILKRQKLPFLTPHEAGVQFHDGRPNLSTDGNNGSLDISTTGDGPYVSVAVENLGEEAAEQLQLACIVDVPTVSDQTIHSGVAELNVDGMFTTPPRGEGALLPPTQGLSLLYGTPQLSTSPTTADEPAMFVASIEKQIKDGNQVRFGFALIFSNSVDDRFYVPLESGYSLSPNAFDDDEDVTLETLAATAVSYDITDLIDETDWSIPEEAFTTRGRARLL